MIYNFLPPDALDENSLSIGRVKDMDLIIVDAPIFGNYDGGTPSHS